MRDTPKTLGRPLKYDDPLERVQILVMKDQRRAAEREAARRAVSISEVYRGWIDKGRKEAKRK